jgi:hypothetical protein
MANTYTQIYIHIQKTGQARYVCVRTVDHEQLGFSVTKSYQRLLQALVVEAAEYKGLDLGAGVGRGPLSCDLSPSNVCEALARSFWAAGAE